MDKPRILIFDIETTHLDADIGKVLCAGWKWHNPDKPTKKVEFAAVWDNPAFYTSAKVDEVRVIKALHAAMSQATHVVAHYGIRFDVPFMNTKFLLHGLPMLLRPEYVIQDTWRVAKDNLKFCSNRLGNIASALNTLEKGRMPYSERYVWKLEKDKAGWGVWNRIMFDRLRSDTKLMEKYNKMDVLVLEQIYARFKPMFKTTLANAFADKDKKVYTCVCCGHYPLRKHGTLPSGKNRYHRLYCNQCGRTQKGPIL